MWIAEVARPASMPIDQVHVAIYSYFPQITPSEARPYVWRLLSPDRLLMASVLRPATPSAREVSVPMGMTLDFRVTYKRVRNSKGPCIRDDGTRRDRKHTPIEIRDHAELKDRLVRFVADRGGDVRYVRIEGLRELRLGQIRLPICDAVGKVYVRDAPAFESLLTSGGPGTGKAYGLGLWYLPELMGEERHHAAA